MMGKVMEEEDSRLFPLPIVHRALNIFTSIFIGVPCAQEPKRRPIDPIRYCYLQQSSHPRYGQCLTNAIP